MEIIEELEPSRRGIYGGAVGYVSYTGNVDLAIAIRTLVTLGDTIHVQAGAGIVADSVPADEHLECVNKARAVLSAVEVARRGAGTRRRTRPLAMLLVIDNYDSFTYNLVQYLGEMGQEVRVVRNDEITAAEIAALAPSHIVISPGPCTPNEAGHQPGGHQDLRREDPDPGRLPRPPGDRPGVRRQGGARRAGDARQDLADLARRQGAVHGAAEPLRGDALPLAAHRAIERAGLPGRHGRDRGRRDHGGPAQDAARRRRAVPPRVVPDHLGQGSAAQLPATAAGHEARP